MLTMGKTVVIVNAGTANEVSESAQDAHVKKAERLLRACSEVKAVEVFDSATEAFERVARARPSEVNVVLYRTRGLTDEARHLKAVYRGVRVVIMSAGIGGADPQLVWVDKLRLDEPETINQILG